MSDSNPNMFDAALLSLRACEPSQLVAALHGLFTNIGKMQENQVEAAYHTITAVRSAMAAEYQPLVAELEDALINRMYELVRTQARQISSYSNLERKWANDLLRKFRRLTPRFRYDLLF